MLSLRWKIGVLLAFLLAGSAWSQATYNCLPTCSSTDGRFLAIANGASFVTMSQPTLDLEISVPRGTSTFTVGIFDGDARGTDASLVPHWDQGTLAAFTYTLYADPNRDHNVSVVEPLSGLPVQLSATMPDNGWIDFTVNTDAAALAPSGHYFYLLRIQLTTPLVQVTNAFKVRTGGAIVGGSSLFPSPQPFSYIANISATTDAQIVYPGYPSLTPTNYDGTFNFYFEMPVSQHDITVWDGDFDYGKFDGSTKDTDDPDTPNAPFRPSWSTTDTVSEGIATGLSGATGNPPDDRNPAGLGIYLQKTPSIFYDLIFPDGQVFRNDNPSGNQEWEQFKISTDPFDPSQMDYNTDVIPPGIYTLNMQGVDMQNLNALLLPAKALCVSSTGQVCTPLHPYLLGDTVFIDTNENGVQDPGELGIGNVELELVDANGFVITTTHTDADGHYSFEVEAFPYTVHIAASNYSGEGGVLVGYNPTTPEECQATITDDNVLTCDFGYKTPASIGNRVWNDSNGNGVQDAGEPGINFVPVSLFDSNGNFVTSDTTHDDGYYNFVNIPAGTYTVRVDDFYLPGGLTPTFDYDGVATPHEAVVTVTGGQTNNDVDFGYQGSGSLGDRVWNDSNGDGVQDAGEAGYTGVTVQLYDDFDNLITSTVTGANGHYSFDHLAEGTYTVRVDTTTLPAGVTQTYDFDGIDTPDVVYFIYVPPGEANNDIDFGYRGAASGSIGDRVWIDSNGDGVQDAGETGVNGVTVELVDSSNNVVATATTAGDGNYTFGSLADGSYTVRIVTATLPAGVEPTYDLDGVATPNAAAVSLSGGANQTDVDFGYRGTASVGDRLWIDGNGDGVQDAGETGINSATVELLDGNGNVVATATTSGDGNYGFSHLMGGNYSVRVVASSLPAGLVPTYDLDGTATANLASFALGGGETKTDVDFGYRGNGTVGDRLWLDTNGDGVQDAGEAGINGVTVQLFDGATLVASTTTGANGIYQFEHLTPGTYTVKVVTASLPAGVTPTYDLDGVATANQATFNLDAGASRSDVDFGYRGTASVGDRVWLDGNGNGAQDAGEAGINGVTVELLDSGNNVVGTTTTAGDGNYTFSNLLGGSYSVRVVTGSLPAGVSPTYDLDGVGTANIATFNLDAEASRTDVDFGYRGTASVGDRVWLDTNGDGVQDAGEAGINGVTVELLDGSTVIATTTTSGDGNYTFTNLNGGIYTVRVSNLPAGVTETYDLDGVASANQATFTLAAGENKTDVDFGYRYSGSVGDRVWIDTNGDGVQDAGEAGINGVTVELLDGSTVIATATTAGDGNYSFTDLAPGTYTVRVSNLPAGVAETYDLDGVATADQATFTLGAGENKTDVDFGYRGTASVGDRVWIDANGNGVQDANEHGLNEVDVELLDGGGNVVATTTTGSDGIYTFANLTAGSYSVRIVASSLPTGLVQTYDLDGVATANVASFTLDAGASRTDVDFGYQGTAKIGDRVWLDSNGDGVQDSGETGINGVTVELLDSASNVVGSAVTSGDGNYTFDHLTAGHFTVRVVTSSLPASLAPTYDLDGIATENVASFDLTGGEDKTDVDFGYRGSGSVGDRLWLDTNGNGVQDPGEAGIVGATVQLFDGSGSLIATTTTAANGIYHFDNLVGGTYTVKVVPSSLPAGVEQTYDLDGVATAHEATFTLGGASRDDVDFGYRGTASVGDRVWIDTNADGVQDAGETGLNGITVELVDSANHVVATAITSGDGSYTFDHLLGGSYTVHIVGTSLPAGLAPTYDLDGVATANQASFLLDAGANRTDVDFGYRYTASVGDRIWIDSNANGAQDAGEAGINGVTVQLVDGSNNVIATAVTSGDGNYTFSNLAGGNYTVRVVASTLPEGVAETYDLDGIASADQAGLTLAAGQQRSDVDFGYRNTGSIGDRLWLDTNANGAQDAGEAGINGVTVQLVNSGGTVVATATTAGDGNYTFSNLAAGTYTVKVVAASLPPGVAQTYDLDGVATANQATVTLTAGQNRTDVDFGYKNTGSIGDRVWLDANGNGAQDSGEAGINGVTVQLVNSGGTVVATATTSGDGNYTFNNLAAGTYTVRVVAASLPAGVAQTYDLDGVATANQATVTLTAGQNRTDVDFGYKNTGSIGDRVWNDADGDGVQDAGEAGINGVTVQLVNSGGTVISTATTSGDGNYTFGGLVAGTYTVRVSPPAGLTQTYDLDGVATANQATFTLTAGQARTDVDFGYRAPVCTGGYFKDTFTSNSFSNNEGTLSWSGAWVENDVAGTGVSSGNVTVGTPVAGYMILRDSPDTGTQPSAARQVNLSGFSSATLTVNFHIRGVESDDAAVIEVSKDGGATYTVLETLTGYTGTYISSRTYDISAYIASNTRIRFRISGNYGASDDYFKIDEVRIDAGCTTQSYSVGDRVWKDTNGNGAQDSGEPGISGVTVQLLNSGGTVVATDTTDSSGIYGFSNIPAGNYTVKVVSSSLPSGYTPTYDLDGTGTAHTASFSLTANRSDVDFGYNLTTTCTGGGYFKDTFTSNSFSNNEGTLSWSGSWVENDVAGTGVNSGNVTVGNPVAGYMILRDSPDTGTQPSAARQVNLTGFSSATLTVDFHIRGVESDDAAVIEVSKDGGATYTVLETLTGYTGTYINSRTYDISAYIASNTRIRFRIASNYGGDDDYFKIDAVRIDTGCTTQAYSVGDRVWKDTNGNGAQDSGEPGISGVTVQLLNSGGTVIATDTTDGNGIYGFSNIPAGNYTVKVVSSTLPAGATPTYDLDGISTPNTVTGPLSENHTDVDFGYKFAAGTLSIGDRVWKDANANGNQDSGEAGISGVTVQLLNSSGTVIATTTTNSSGNYSFGSLAAGTYTVKIVTSSLPSGATQTYDLDGLSSANQATVNLTASRTDVDFGYHIPVANCGGTGTLGYWKNHPDAWPVQSIVIGGVSYTKTQAINWLKTPVRGDASISLFQQLVPAELNALVGNNVSCITTIIQAADDWMTAHPVGSGVSTSSSAGQTAVTLASKLDDYNNGELSCAQHRN